MSILFCYFNSSKSTEITNTSPTQLKNGEFAWVCLLAKFILNKKEHMKGKKLGSAGFESILSCSIKLYCLKISKGRHYNKYSMYILHIGGDN